MKLLAALGFLFSVIALCQASDFKVFIDIKDLLFDDKLVKLDVSTMRSDSQTTLNMNGDIFYDITESLSIHIAGFEKIDGKLIHLANGTANVCNVLSRFISHPVLKYVLQELLKASNIPMACPINKGSYHIKDFTLKVDLLQVFLPQGSFLGILNLNRILSGGEAPLISGKVQLDIINPQEKKGFKLF